MAYGKRKTYRRRTLRRPRRAGSSWYRKKYSAMDMGKMALSQIWKLKGLVNSEVFKLDGTFSNVSLTSGSASLITGVAQGDGDGQRTGNSIFCRSWNFNGSINHNVNGQNNQVCRLSIIQDTQQISDTNPGYADIYEAKTPYTHLNSDTVGRFKVLWTHTYTVNNYDKNNALVKINIPMRHHVRFNGSAATDIQKGGLYLCMSCDEVGANFPQISGEFRLSYHDN